MEINLNAPKKIVLQEEKSKTVKTLPTPLDTPKIKDSGSNGIENVNIII